ncbi:MAG TPA: tRNA lysidine(34) synthetase TilS [Steroidobacteraceae bacterium]
MARAPPRGAVKFAPAWLAARLRALVPGFPRVAACVAFSGGADSTALLAALARLRRGGLQVRAVHIDHQLRPDSARWSAHCRRCARALGVPLEVRRILVPRARGSSPEAAARLARYAALAQALRPHEVLLTAHHQDDQLETVLLQLLRGAGVAGLAAMPASAPFARGLLVRPLLEIPRAQLREWLRARRLEWVEDDSNADEALDRNYLRRRVLPALSARWPAAPATVARSARHLADAQQLLEALGAADAASAQVGAALSAPVLRRLGPARRRNALRHWITASGFPAPPARRLEEIAAAVLAARTDTHPFVAWSGVRVRRHAQLLRLEAATATATAPATPAQLSWRWQQQPQLAWPGGGVLTLRADRRGPLDLEALSPVLSVRTRRGGERLRPAAGGPRRLLKGLLQEARVPLPERARLPLLYCGERLVAVGDRWLDASVQAGAQTRRRGRLRHRAAP